MDAVTEPKMTEPAKPKRPRGRPPGSKNRIKRFGRSKVAPELEQRAIRMLFEEGVSYWTVAEELGLGDHVVQLIIHREVGRREARADPVVDPSTLPKTTQEKLAIALRQQQRAQNNEFEKRVAAEYTLRVKRQFPELEKMEREARELRRTYERLLRESKKLGTQAEWNNLVLCLHPDTRRTASDEKFDGAFRWVLSRKFAITGES